MNVSRSILDAANFFREDLSEIIAAYFDGEKIFIARLTDKSATAESEAEVEVDAYGCEIEQVAEKISQTCRQRGWKTSAVGFCLQESDAVTFQTEVANVPAKEIPALVKSWAKAQAGADAALAFTALGEEIWMETLPRTKFLEICAAFEKFGLTLRALSIMPNDALTKSPFERTEFIAAVIREKKSPNLLSARSSVWSWEKISAAVATLFLCALIFMSAKVLLNEHAAQETLEAARASLDARREELALKENLDADIAELKRLNDICAAQDISPTNFNFLLNLGKIAGGGVHLTRIRIDEDSLELEGLANTPDAVKSYLSRVKSSVSSSARLENSSERDDGDIVFRIRAKKRQRS